MDSADREYFYWRIAPLIQGPGIEFIGEINEQQKTAFLGGALALLFPIDWPEPFGLAMIEAMACGTPVIAFRCGSVPEIIDSGITGFIVGSLDEGAQCVERAKQLSRHRIRQVFEEKFSAGRMARDYCEVYGRCYEPAALHGEPGAVSHHAHQNRL